jgi:putative transposase
LRVRKESESEELKRLRHENKILKQERDILYPKGRLRAKRQQHPKSISSLRSPHVLCKRPRCPLRVNPIRYAFIKENRYRFRINSMCKVLRVNKSSYYHWIKVGSVIKKVDKRLNELIEIIFVQGRANYGTRRIVDKLKELYGLIISRKRISNIMKDLKLKVKMKRRYKNTTDSNHNLPIAANILNRDFYASNPNEKYVGDRSVNKKILNISFFNTRIYSNR